MAYDVDYDFEFDEDEFGTAMMPNGRYLPPGNYRTEDGGDIIYEPRELSPYAEMLSQFR